MPSITLYGGRSGSSFRPHWMLAELGLSYETKDVDMANGAHRQPEFLAMNPAGQIPVMVHDGFVLTESVAMVNFLAEKYDGSFFGPNTPEAHATMMRWELFVLLNIDKNFVTLAMKKWGQPSSPENEASATQSLARYLAVLEAHLSKSSWLAGDAFTVADIVARSSFNYAELAEVDLSTYPSITAWMTRCAERPAYAKAKQG